MEETNGESETHHPVKLESDVVNSIRHSFETLDESGSGEVAKSQLQVLCASICRDVGVAYNSHDLADFSPYSTTLNARDFTEYLQSNLLPRGQKEIDFTKIHELCWKIVEQKFLKSSDHMLGEQSAFKQFLVFNILDIEETSKVDKEEIGIILERFMHAMGRVWDPKPLEEFCAESEVLTFWEYLDCLEKRYIPGNDKNVVDEALEEVVDHVVNEVIKQGYLVKKGHKMKSMKERWCVLKPGNLAYYTNRTCAEQKGVIVINKSSAVESVAAKGKYRFAIKCGESETNYEMEAKDQKSRQEWIAGIQAAIDTSDGPTPQRKERLQRRLDRNERRQKKLEDERRKKEQEDFMLQQQQELARLQELYQQAEGKAAEEAALLQEEIKKREELERLQKELQQLLETERKAKEEEEKVRALQEKLLEDERKRLEEMERLRLEKEQLLQDEMRMREDLEERHKQQEKILEEERKRHEQLDKERAAAEEAMKEAQQKLEAAEEASKRAAEEAKKKAREIKTAVGLARTIGPRVPSWTTHRGLGAFCVGDFVKSKTNDEAKEDGNGNGNDNKTDNSPNPPSVKEQPETKSVLSLAEAVLNDKQTHEEQPQESTTNAEASQQQVETPDSGKDDLPVTDETTDETTGDGDGVTATTDIDLPVTDETTDETTGDGDGVTATTDIDLPVTDETTDETTGDGDGVTATTDIDLPVTDETTDETTGDGDGDGVTATTDIAETTKAKADDAPPQVQTE